MYPGSPSQYLINIHIIHTSNTICSSQIIINSNIINIINNS